MEALPTAISVLWEAACEYDSIEPTAMFVVFSKHNPYVDLYDQAARDYQERKRS